jgi:hypothetical protein
MTDEARREVLIAAGAMAVSGAISAGTGGAFAQNAGSILASEWDYRSIKELSEALQARKISALARFLRTSAPTSWARDSSRMAFGDRIKIAHAASPR